MILVIDFAGTKQPTDGAPHPRGFRSFIGSFTSRATPTGQEQYKTIGYESDKRPLSLLLRQSFKIQTPSL